MARLRTWSIAIAVVLIAFWIFTPMARAMWLLHDVQHPMGDPPIIAGKQSLDAHFYTTEDSTASDPNVEPNPIPIAGWLVVTNQNAPTVILLPGWKDDRNSMLKYADFLVSGGLNVLLIDMQGSGHSGGAFTLGFDEPTDVKAAVSYLDTDQGITNHHYGVLGVGFGAGVGIAAAGGDGNPYPGDPEISAVVADSPWATEDAQVNDLNQISIGGLTIPFPRTNRFFGHAMPPDAGWTIDETIGGSPDTRSALQGAAHLQAQQALFIIYGDHPSDPSITQAAAQQLYQTATVTHKAYWDAPRTGQGDAYDDQPAAYSAKVLAFFKSYLVSLKNPPAVNSGNPGNVGH